MMKFSAVLITCLFYFKSVSAQTIPSKYFNDMRWRCIGPFRGGRTVGACGVAKQPNVFYIGVNNGGVWRTNDYGRTWKPVFDEQPTGSIGDVVVAPSNPDVIYVASGEGIQRPDLSVGDGVYKSTDAGRTWINTGLHDAQQIGGLSIDPINENRVFVAALGHPYGPNKERGVFRTNDGGRSWQNVLFIDENTGAVQVQIDPKNTNIVFAVMWAGRQGPWENGAWNGKESGLYKSTDGGASWKKITNGLPTTDQGLGRIGFCIAPSDDQRMYATVDAVKYGGIYRSDDGGENWHLQNADNRYWGRGSDFAEVKADPKNPDIVYTADVVTWKSIDGGKTFSAWRGAPGGDDYHRLWINPNDPNIILVACDQGAIITVNGGETFSSWYNQPTAQFYHVSADNDFPYNVYSGQQESGSVGIASRGNDGEITFHDWHPVSAEEYGYVVADPKDPNIVFGGKITKYNKLTGQVQNISPDAARSGKYRFIRTAPIIFSPVDNKTLYYAGNVLFKTNDGGHSWQTISPDLTRETYDIPSSVGIYTTDDMKKMPRRGVIYTIAPSFKDTSTIWCGTDDGLIQVTHDGGKAWKDVTPAGISSWSKISIMDAGHYDVNTAYAAVNRIRCDDMNPHIYKTHDGGKTWTEIVNGLPMDPVNVVREDPQVKGLLYAGTERAVYVSFDDGENWQTLRLNMPATSIRDLVIKDDDIVIGTHGRGFWILDDVTPLRQLVMKKLSPDIILYKPQTATRVRWSMYPDTPYPQEEPAGENPPDGAVIDYWLDRNMSVTLQIKDEKGKLVRMFTSMDTLYKIGEQNIPEYWIRPQQILSGKPGHHRFLWDLRYTPLNVHPSYPISATYENTAPEATSPWVMPGKYTVELKADNFYQTFTQSFEVRMDPRVKTGTKDLQQQFELSNTCYEIRRDCVELLKQVHAFRAKVQSQLMNAENSVANKLSPLDQEAAKLENPNPRGSEPGFARIAGEAAGLFNILEGTDMPPTAQSVAAVADLKKQFDQLVTKFSELKSKL